MAVITCVHMTTSTTTVSLVSQLRRTRSRLRAYGQRYEGHSKRLLASTRSGSFNWMKTKTR